eukprot:jgi/Mesen1/6848/ME000351S05966
MRKSLMRDVVKEHYLRDDISCGAIACTSDVCNKDDAKLSDTAEHLLVIDTNVALHQIDLLENAAIADVVVLSVVLEEVKHKNLSAYNRLRALCSNPLRRFFVFSNEHHRSTYIKADPGETPNDRNDRAIRVAAKWYKEHLGGGVHGWLGPGPIGPGPGSDKVRGLALARSGAVAHPLAGQDGEDDVAADQEPGDSRPAKRSVIYAEVKGEGHKGGDGEGDGEGDEEPDARRPTAHTCPAWGRGRGGEQHKGMAEITAGLQRGIFHQGKLRVGRYNCWEAYVGSESLGDEVLILGRPDMNRAVDGDVVAVQLYPRDQWREASAGHLAEAHDDEEEQDAAGLPPDSADDVPHSAAPGADSSQPSTSGNGAAPPGSLARPTGKVVGIIKRNWRSYCGSFEPARAGAGSAAAVQALFVSTDRRIPKVRVRTRQFNALVSKRIIVAIDAWERTSPFPTGHYVKTLGDIGDRATESEVPGQGMLLLAMCVCAISPTITRAQFAAGDVRDLLEPAAEAVRPFLLEQARAGCRDIDDALHCTALPNGNFEVGVRIPFDGLPLSPALSILPSRPPTREAERRRSAQLACDDELARHLLAFAVLSAPVSAGDAAYDIADVTNFVLPGSPLDEEAAQRGTSVYLVEKRIDMLPKPLTEDICSLRADVERLAFSVVWEMNALAEVVSARFTKSVIKSSAALSYAEAQARMDDSRLSDGITTDLRNMNRLAKMMRQRRIERGALTLASPERLAATSVPGTPRPPAALPLALPPSFSLRDICMLRVLTRARDTWRRAGMYMVREANQMVEEFMLAANMSIAENILTHFPMRHPAPTPKMFEPLLRTAAAVGAHLDTSSSKALADSLDLAVGEDPYFNKLIRILATRCMTQWALVGMCLPRHVLVHRLLAASLALTPVPSQMKDKSALNAVTDNLNYRHRNAQMAGRASVELHTLIFFRTRPTDAEARVVMVRSNGFIVFVPKFGIEGPVYLVPKDSKKKGGKAPAAEKMGAEGEWKVDEEHQVVSSLDGTRTYKVLDIVTVHIEIIEPQPNRFKLALTLVPGERNPAITL